MLTANDDGVEVKFGGVSELSVINTTDNEFRFVFTETKVETELTLRDDTLIEKLGDERNSVGVVFIVDTETHQTIRF